MADNSEIIIFKTADGNVSVDIVMENETVWVTQNDLSRIFEKDQSVISRHIANIFQEGEVDKESNMQKMHIANSAKPVEFYSLDIVLAVGYRTNSAKAVEFRKWATERLKEYIIKGFTMDDERLKSLGGGDYWKELLERICSFDKEEVPPLLLICVLIVF